MKYVSVIGCHYCIELARNVISNGILEIVEAFMVMRGLGRLSLRLTIVVAIWVYNPAESSYTLRP
jgi:hypothetical protein